MRFQKPVSVILIAAFVLMTADCVTTRNVASARLEPTERDYQIVRILKKSGERIDVDKANPARILGDEIYIRGVLKVPAAGTTIAERDGGFVLTSVDGSTYETNDIGRGGGYLIFRTKSDIVIPLSEVSAISSREKNTGLTILTVVGVVAVVVGAALALAWSALKNSLSPW